MALVPTQAGYLSQAPPIAAVPNAWVLHDGKAGMRSQALGLAEATVKSHVTHVYRKLHAGNRAEAVQRYMRLLSLDHQ